MNIENKEMLNKEQIKKIVIACLIIFLIVSIAITRAKFTEAKEARDTARVAIAAGKVAEIQFTSSEMAPGSTDGSKSIIVSNEVNGAVGETALSYTVEVTNLSGNIPLIFTLSSAEVPSSGEQALTWDSTAKCWKGGMMPPGNKTEHKYRLTMKWDNTAENYDAYKYQSMIDQIGVKFKAEQID